MNPSKFIYTIGGLLNTSYPDLSGWERQVMFFFLRNKHDFFYEQEIVNEVEYTGIPEYSIRTSIKSLHRKGYITRSERIPTEISRKPIIVDSPPNRIPEELISYETSPGRVHIVIEGTMDEIIGYEIYINDRYADYLDYRSGGTHYLFEPTNPTIENKICIIPIGYERKIPTYWRKLYLYGLIGDEIGGMR